MTAACNTAVFLPNWVGDVVMATPALTALRAHAKGAHIVHIGRGVAIEVLEGCGLSDETIVDQSNKPPKISNFLALRRELRRRKFDLAILLPNSFRSALAAWSGGCRRIVGYARDGRGWMLTDSLRPPRKDGKFTPEPMIDYYNRLVEVLGVAKPDRQMRLAESPAGAAAAQKLLTQNGYDPKRPLVMLNPGASFGTSKIWPAQRYGALADAMVLRWNVQIIINAAPAEQPIAAAVAGAMKEKPLINFASLGNSISLVKSLMAKCKLLVTNDTGARHIGAALGTGVVTIFGSTDPVWAQIDYPRERIVKVSVPCSPCQQKTCKLKPGDSFHQCMTAITTEMVLGAVEELM